MTDPGEVWLARVYRSSKATGTARLVLAYLAVHADEDGECCPVMVEVAAGTNTDLRTVRRVIRRLEALGELVTTRGGGSDRRGHRYRIVLDGVDRAGERYAALVAAGVTGR